MRVDVASETRHDDCDKGDFLGLLRDERSGELLAVVRLDGSGLMLRAVHPSRVVPALPER